MSDYDKQTQYLIREIREEISQDTSSVEKGALFLEWVLKSMFGKVESEVGRDLESEVGRDLESGDVLILDGKDDGGIDACFIENNELNIIQAKYNQSHSKESINYFIKQIKDLFIEEKKLSARVNEVIQRIADNEITNLKIYYITDGADTLTQYNELINEGNYYIEFKALGIKDIVEYLKQRYAPIPEQIKKDFKIMVESYFINREKNTIVAEVSVKEIAKLVWNGKDYLYHSNIRNHLGNNKVNKKIQETIQGNAKDFWFYNNGITIVCNSFEKDDSHYKNGAAKVTINTPQIVNGCQTTKTIFKYMYPRNRKREDFDTTEGTILVKIIKDTNEKRKAITRYTNSQTAVSGKDFYALEEYQQKLRSRFEDLGYNYEIQTKAYIDREYRGKQEYDYLFDESFTRRKTRSSTMSKKMGNKINVNESTQAYVAGMLGKPGKATSKSNYAPGTNLYEQIYNNESSPEDPRYFLFPFGIVYYFKKIKNNNSADGKSRSLFFCQVYFKVLLEIFKKFKAIDASASNFIDSITFEEQQKNIIIIDSIIQNKELNKRILDISEEIVIDFFLDGKIKELIGDNLPKFLKNAIETSNDSKMVLNNQIDKQLKYKCKDMFERVDLKRLFDKEIQ